MCYPFSWPIWDLLYLLSWWIITLQPTGLILWIHPGCIKLFAVMQVCRQSNVANLMQNKGEAMLSCMPERERERDVGEMMNFPLRPLSRNNKWMCFRYRLENLYTSLSSASCPAALNGAPRGQWIAHPKDTRPPPTSCLISILGSPLRPGALDRGVLSSRNTWRCSGWSWLGFKAGVCYQHLVSRGQRCCWTFCHAQESPTTGNHSAPNTNRPTDPALDYKPLENWVLLFFFSPNPSTQ